MPIVLIVGLLAVGLAGCATGRDSVEYIPGDRAVVPLKAGQPAPADGWFVPPAVMQNVVPFLDQEFRNSDTADPIPEKNNG